MMEHNNQNTIAIHVTDMCNLRCPLCYLEKEPRVIDFKYIRKAVDIFKPSFVVMFGGEAILCPDIIFKFREEYPDIKIILHTNGTTYNTDIYDICDIVYMTIESFFYKYNRIHRNMTYAQYSNFLKSIDYCKDKIEAIHNIYPSDNDYAFYPMARLANIRYANYLIVSNEEACDIDPFFYSQLIVRNDILIDPKIRILVDGTVTRDMTGVFNICHIDEYEKGMDKLLPVANKCIACNHYKNCYACNLFPHFCKEILDTIDYKPSFCKLADTMEGANTQ